MIGGEVSIRHVWGFDIGILNALVLKFRDTVGLDPVNQKLLIQRDAIDDSSTLDDGKATVEDSEAMPMLRSMALVTFSWGEERVFFYRPQVVV